MEDKEIELELFEIICRLIKQYEKLSKRNFETDYYNVQRGD